MDKYSKLGLKVSATITTRKASRAVQPRHVNS